MRYIHYTTKIKTKDDFFCVSLVVGGAVVNFPPLVQLLLFCFVFILVRLKRERTILRLLFLKLF